MSFLVNLPSDHPFLSFEVIETEHDFLVYCMFKDVFLNGKPITHHILEQSVVYAIPKLLFLNADEEIVDEAKKRSVPAIMNHFIDGVNKDSVAARNAFILYDSKGVYWERIPVFLSMFVKKFKMITVLCSVSGDDVKIRIKEADSVKMTDVIGGHVPTIEPVEVSVPKKDIEAMAATITEQYDSVKANDVVKSYIFSMFGNWFSNPPVKKPVDSGAKRLDLRSLLNDTKR